MSVVAESGTAEEFDQTTQTLITSLGEWFELIPEEWKYSEENLLRWAELDMGRLFMSLYIDFNHACQLLLFRFLYLSQDDTLCTAEEASYDLACQLAKKCSSHAANICQLVRDSSQHENTQMVHSLLDHMMCISFTLLIHSLLFSDDEVKIAVARTRLEESFTFLGQVYKHWPNVVASFSRLEAFHNACLQGKESSFRLDRWMLQFIVEFARLVQEKKSVTYAEHSKELSNLGRLRYLLQP